MQIFLRKKNMFYNIKNFYQNICIIKNKVLNLRMLLEKGITQKVNNNF